MSRDVLWEEIFSTRPWGKYPAEEFIRFLATRFYAHHPRHEIRLFEAGFGTGANLWYAAREGFAVNGVEGAASGLQVAEARLDHEVPDWRKHGASLQVGDICERLPYESDSFDAVIDSDAVTCNSFADAKRAYAEMFRIARPNGWLYVRTPATGSWGDGTGVAHGHHAWRCSEGPFAGTGVVRFTPEGDIPELLGQWHVENLEQVTRTLENRSRSVVEWVIAARKR